MFYSDQVPITKAFKVTKKKFSHLSKPASNDSKIFPNSEFYQQNGSIPENLESQEKRTCEQLSGHELSETTSPSKKKVKKERFGGCSEQEVLSRGLPDLLVSGLDIVIVGFNPGLMAAYVGHHYAGPGNHFWKCLHMSGLTKELLHARQDAQLMREYNIGLTNVVSRTSRGSSDLSRKEIKEGASQLMERLLFYKPLIVVFNGKGIYEVVRGNKDFPLGRQAEKLEGSDTEVFVMPSSSARCSQLPRAVDKVPYYIALKKLRDLLKGDQAIGLHELVFHDVQLKVKKKEKGEVKEEMREGVKEEMEKEKVKEKEKLMRVVDDGTKPTEKKKGRKRTKKKNEEEGTTLGQNEGWCGGVDAGRSVEGVVKLERLYPSLELSAPFLHPHHHPSHHPQGSNESNLQYAPSFIHHTSTTSSLSPYFPQYPLNHVSSSHQNILFASQMMHRFNTPQGYTENYDTLNLYNTTYAPSNNVPCITTDVCESSARRAENCRFVKVKEENITVAEGAHTTRNTSQAFLPATGDGRKVDSTQTVASKYFRVDEL